MNEQSWTIDAEAVSCGIRVQIAQCDWPRPTEYYETCSWHVLNLSLTAIPNTIEGRIDARSEAAQCIGVGKLVFVPAMSRISCRGSGGRHQRVVRAFLDPQFLATRLARAEQFGRDSLRRCLDIQAPTLARTMIRLCRETLQPDFGMGIMVESLGRVMAVELERMFLPEPTTRQAAPVPSGVLSRAELRRIMDYIDSHSSAGVTITDVAIACNMSSRTLTRKFKQTTGETLHDYAHRQATSRARALLANRDRSIKEVSYDLGYPNPSAFSIAFRRATGTSPSEYRRSVA
jgi:AraC family transcriptional regulator